MRLAVSAEAMAPGDLANLVEDVVAPRLQAVEGVAQAQVYGDRKRAIRVRIMPASLAARGFSVDDVARLVSSASVPASAGRLRNATQDLLIRAETPATRPEEIGALRLDDLTRLSDVALVEWSFEDETTSARVNGAPGVGVGILRQAQSNTVAVSKGVRAAVADLNKNLPAGVKVDINTDDSIFIERSIEEVIGSLLAATAIVIAGIFFFLRSWRGAVIPAGGPSGLAFWRVAVIFFLLRSWRATIIPAVAIPVSLFGTVAAIYLAGFSVNLLTLLALVMATGLVVDEDRKSTRLN